MWPGERPRCRNSTPAPSGSSCGVPQRGRVAPPPCWRRLQHSGEPTMPVTIEVNKMSVSHKGSSGISTAFPDVCKTPAPPAPPIPIPYPNIAMSSDTADGSSTVKMDGNMIMIKGANLKTSTGDEAGALNGVVSSKIKGKAEFVNYSFDVK